MAAEENGKASVSRMGVFFVGLVLVATVGLSIYHIMQMKRFNNELEQTKRQAEESRKSSMLNKGEADRLRQEFEDFKKKLMEKAPAAP